MRSLCVLTIGLACSIATSALADDPGQGGTISRPVWSVVGSLQGTYTDNAFLASSGRRSDFYGTPDITIRADGKLTSGIYYRFYARGEFDAFNDETDANNAVARVGARLSGELFDWTASIAYENRYSFDGIFQERLFTSHDVIGSVTRSFDCGLATLSPGGLLTYRFADVAESQRFRMEIWLGIEVPINQKWSIVSEPFFEQFWFTDGLNAGRQDQVYSVSLGLQYKLTDNALLTTEVVYENRTSNRSGRDYDLIEIGPRLDFAY